MTVLSKGNTLEREGFSKVKIGNPQAFEQATGDAGLTSDQEL
jgi:hypothetical protein